MPILDSQRLNRFMKEPKWPPSVYEEAADLVVTLEGTLEDRLNTFITPRPWSERAAILPSGLVHTTYPVASVTSLDGVAVVGGVLPTGWTISNHWLRYDASAVSVPPSFSLMTGWSYGAAARVESVGSVNVVYGAGLGDVPSIRLLLLRKGKTIMENRYDTTVIARNLDTTAPPPVVREDFTDEELAPLGKYRNIMNWR